MYQVQDNRMRFASAIFNYASSQNGEDINANFSIVAIKLHLGRYYLEQKIPVCMYMKISQPLLSTQHMQF